ncbi:UNVERIFIED_CONTAM: hypothetical protein GTU68_056388 [Idotea baltica]|nr:hypothetical protein [Idotea baltica]
MYSALKHEGQPLYKLARAGETVARKARTVIIHHIELLEIKGTQAHLYVSCSKGTYIRTLAEDIGSFLGCNAHLASLRRVKAGPFDLSHTVTLTQLEKLYEDKGSEFLDQFLQPIDSGLNDWPLLTFSSESAFYWLRGQAVSVPDTPSFGMVRVRDINNRFLGIGQVSADKRILPKRLIRTV